MTSSRLKLAGFWRMGNSLKLSSHRATNNCAGGDTPTNFIPALGYFTDNLTPVAGTINDEYLFLQLLRTLRVTNGTSLGPNSDGRNGTYGRGNPNFPLPTDPNGLLRKQVAVFIMRGFFF